MRAAILIISLGMVSSIHSSVAATGVPKPEATGDIRAFVQKAAADAFAQAPKTVLTQSNSEFYRKFDQKFLDGFLHPEASSYSEYLDGGYLGYLAGQSYGRTHGQERDLVLRSYGYVRVECSGVLHFTAEMNSFEPDRNGGVWWLEPIGGKLRLRLPFSPNGMDWWLESIGAEWPEGTTPKDIKEEYVFHVVRLKVTGYLSPKGKYGHGGQFRRQLLATKITREDLGHDQAKKEQNR